MLPRTEFPSSRRLTYRGDYCRFQTASFTTSSNLWTITGFSTSNRVKKAAFVRTKLKNVLSGRWSTRRSTRRRQVRDRHRRPTTPRIYRDGSDGRLRWTAANFEQHAAGSLVSTTTPASSWKVCPYRSRLQQRPALYLELPVHGGIPSLTDLDSRAIVPTPAPSRPRWRRCRNSGALFINPGDKLKVDSRDGNYLVA